jgi:hypothetical protein
MRRDERTTANRLECVTRRRLGTAGLTKLGRGLGTSSASRGVRDTLESEGARGGREEGSSTIFIERGKERRGSAGVMPLMAFKDLEWRERNGRVESPLTEEKQTRLFGFGCFVRRFGWLARSA